MFIDYEVRDPGRPSIATEKKSKVRHADNKCKPIQKSTTSYLLFFLQILHFLYVIIDDLNIPTVTNDVKIKISTFFI